MEYADRHDEKKQKKINRVFRKSAYAVGMGVGLFILRMLVVPFMGENEMAETALFVFSLSLIGYGGTIFLTFIFKKNWLLKIDMLASWVILPLILVKLLMDAL